MTGALARACALLLAALGLSACSNDDGAVLADAAHDASSTTAAKQLLVVRSQNLVAAAISIQAAAPASGWDAASDPAAVAAMKAAWKDARTAYQGLEGMADQAFPDLDASLDTRYDDELALSPDPDPFDGEGFVGMHAIERILWSDSIPPSVIAFESTLPGYVAPAFPTTAAEAAEFKEELCARLVADAGALQAQVAALSLGSPPAYAAGIAQVRAQVIKIEEAGAGKDESRYAGYTLADMRADVTAAQAVHASFHAWLLTKPGGPRVDAEIAAGFSRLEGALAAAPGDALPPAPPGWSSTAATAPMLATPFGTLFQAVGAESDDKTDGSLAASMTEAVGLLGISPLAPDAGAPVRPHDAT